MPLALICEIKSSVTGCSRNAMPELSGALLFAFPPPGGYGYPHRVGTVDGTRTAPDVDQIALCKVSCSVSEVDAIPEVLRQTFSSMLSGRPGPASLELLIETQIATSESKLDFSAQRQPNLKLCPDVELA